MSKKRPLNRLVSAGRTLGEANMTIIAYKMRRITPMLSQSKGVMS